VVILHQIASSQSASFLFCILYACIECVIYIMTPPPLLFYLSFLNITQIESASSASTMSLCAYDSVMPIVSCSIWVYCDFFLVSVSVQFICPGSVYPPVHSIVPVASPMHAPNELAPPNCCSLSRKVKPIVHNKFFSLYKACPHHNKADSFIHAKRL